MAKKRTPPKKPAAAAPKGRPKALARRAAAPSQAEFDEILALIDDARARALAAVNTALIDLYWQIGEHICRRVAADGWGQGTVKALAEHIRKHHANARGFSAQNLWRMRQFFETYRVQPKLSALLRELSWTNNLDLSFRTSRFEYLRISGPWSAQAS
jgi:hypothetical protein